MTGLDIAAVEYLRTRRAMGYQLRQHGQMLSQFVGYLDAVGAERLTVEHALAWSCQPADASRVWWTERLRVVRGFARYLAVLDPATEIPPSGLIPEPGHRTTPYIYSAAEVDRLIGAAGRLHNAHRADTYRTVIGLLAVTGMRGGEVVRLDREDVDLERGLLTIRNSKYGKSRQIPVHLSTVTALAGYAARRDSRTPLRDGRRHHHPCNPDSFFTSATGTRLLRDNVSQVVTRLVREVGLAATAAGGRAPRAHDLRHTFAVRTLIRWHHEGVDVDARLPLLSTYLGHASTADTYWYLTAVPELLETVADRLDIAAGVQL